MLAPDSVKVSHSCVCVSCCVCAGQGPQQLNLQDLPAGAVQHIITQIPRMARAHLSVVSKFMRAQLKASLDTLALDLAAITCPPGVQGPLFGARRLMGLVVQLTSLKHLVLLNGEQAPLLQQALVSHLPAYPTVASKLTGLILRHPSHPTHAGLATALPALTRLTRLVTTDATTYNHDDDAEEYQYGLTEMLGALTARQQLPSASRLRVLHITVHITYGPADAQLNAALGALTSLTDLQLVMKSVIASRPSPEISFGARRLTRLSIQRILSAPMAWNPPPLHSAALVQSIKGNADSLTRLALYGISMGTDGDAPRQMLAPMGNLRDLTLDDVPMARDQFVYLLREFVPQLFDFSLTALSIDVHWEDIVVYPAPAAEEPAGQLQAEVQDQAEPAAEPAGQLQEPTQQHAAEEQDQPAEEQQPAPESSLRRLWLDIDDAVALPALLQTHPGVTDLTVISAHLSEGLLDMDLVPALEHVPGLQRLTLHDNELNRHDSLTEFCRVLGALSELKYLSITGHDLTNRQRKAIRDALAGRPNFAGRMRVFFNDD